MDEVSSPCEWSWRLPPNSNGSSVQLSEGSSRVLFHPVYSSGTAVVQGDTPLARPLHHFWEVRMLSTLYGTDMMLGIATSKQDLVRHRHSFGSVIGHDQESWGFSYQGYIQQGGVKTDYGRRWKGGDVIGVHYDSWRGTLEFMINREPLGIAFTGLQTRGDLYPVVSSTAARSVMQLVTTHSVRNSLQFDCMNILTRKFQHYYNVEYLLPPGLKTFLKNNYGFLAREEPPCIIIAPEVTQMLGNDGECSAKCSRKPNRRKKRIVRAPSLNSSAASETDEESFLVRPNKRRKETKDLKLKSEETRVVSDIPVVASSSCSKLDMSSKPRKSSKICDVGSEADNGETEISKPASPLRKKKYRLRSHMKHSK